jgi:flagellar hook-associated protein 1 FlgK
VQTLDGGQAGALLELSNNFVPTVQKRLDTIAMGLVKVANSAAQTSSGTATNLAIFGFKVADKTYSSLASSDLTGQLPTIENENDLLDLHSSLGNAISSNSAVKVGNLVGTYTSISSLTAGSTTLAGDYTLTKVGTNQLNIADSSGKNQTVSLSTSVSGGLQTVDFNQLGITLQLENFSPALIAVSSSSVIKNTATLPVGAVGAAITQTVSNMALQNNVQSGTYTFSASSNQVTLTSSNGGSQTLTVAEGTAAGQTLNFSNMGISFSISDTGSPVQTAATIAGYLNSRTITLENAEDSQATIATALNGLKIKVSGMSNPLVNYGLNAANFVSLAPSNFASYFNGNTPLITSSKANATQQMSAVFGTSISNLINEVGVQVAIWKNGQKADSVVLANLKAQRDSVSGVNLDEEAANLLKYQQLYTASTKVLQAGNQMFSTLLSIMN